MKVGDKVKVVGYYNPKVQALGQLATHEWMGAVGVVSGVRSLEEDDCWDVEVSFDMCLGVPFHSLELEVINEQV
jgi:hypothetical protein